MPLTRCYYRLGKLPFALALTPTTPCCRKRLKDGQSACWNRFCPVTCRSSTRSTSATCRYVFSEYIINVLYTFRLVYRMSVAVFPEITTACAACPSSKRMALSASTWLICLLLALTLSTVSLASTLTFLSVICKLPDFQFCMHKL